MSVKFSTELSLGNVEKMLLIAHTGDEDVRGMLEIEDMFFKRPMCISKVALRAGSSKHGNALLASVGWNWVAAIHLICN